MRRARASFLAGAVVLAAVACGGRPDAYRRDDLPGLVLQPGDAPAGTAADAANSGFRDLAAFAEDETEARALSEAGFREAYYAWFSAPGALAGEPGAVLAFSFAVRFATRQGAAQGLRAIEADVRADGKDLADIARPAFGDASFAVKGRLDPERPPGYLFAWRARNAVLGLVAAGAEGTVREDAARALAARMAARAD